MGSRGQSRQKSRWRAGNRASEPAPKETPEQRRAREAEFRRTHVRFLGEWVERPDTLSGWAEMGKLHELFNDKVVVEHEGFGYSSEIETLKSAEEIKEILNGMNDLGVNVSRMKNPEKMMERILEAAAAHNLEKAKSDHDWAIRILGAGEDNGRFRGGPGDGTAVYEILGTNIKHYRDKDLAKKWYREWAKILHPDNNPGNPKAETAMRRVRERYESMIRR